MTIIARQHRKLPHMNLTPLIDVIFLLIVFFMLTSKFSLDKVIDTGVAPVASKAVSDNVQKNTVLIMLQKNGDFRLWSEDGAGSEQVLPINKLKEIVKPLLVRDKERELVIVVHESSNVQQAVAALEAVQIAGGKKVRLAEGLE